MRSRLLTCLLLLCLLLGISQIAVASDPESIPAAPQAPSTWYFPVSAHKAVLGNPYITAPMVLIPGGDFPMGCDPANVHDLCNYDEGPLHLVWIDTFWMDRTEVTNGQYEMCVLDGGCTLPIDSASVGQPYYGEAAYADYPVVWVDWNQASVYCAWKGKRLPTEAEWEKSARGSSDTRVYPWGDQYPDCSRTNHMVFGNPLQFCVGRTTKVGSYPLGQSAHLAYDMAGNVSEWVADWYDDDYYVWSAYSNPPGPTTTSGQEKVTRGGSWADPPYLIRVAGRLERPPTYAQQYLGFRCARDDQSLTSAPAESAAHPAGAVSLVITGCFEASRG